MAKSSPRKEYLVLRYLARFQSYNKPMKIASDQLNPYHWGVLLILLVTVAGAIYAATTWDNNVTPASSYHRQSAEIPDQSRAAGLQVQNSDNGLSGNTSSEALQAPTSTTSASSTQSNTADNEVPPNPEPCRGVDMGGSAMCLAP